MRFDAKQLREMSKSVRAHALDAIRHAGSGHVGIVLGAADIITAIYANFLRVGVDKFVLSAGHGSALLYSVLSLAGYDVGDLESFRKIGGLPGHPEFGMTDTWVLYKSISSNDEHKQNAYSSITLTEDGIVISLSEEQL